MTDNPAQEIYEDDGRYSQGRQEDHKGKWGHHSDERVPDRSDQARHQRRLEKQERLIRGKK
jgi:hypothetical protein